MTDVELWLSYSNIWLCTKNSDSFKNVINKVCLEIIYMFNQSGLGSNGNERVLHIP